MTTMWPCSLYLDCGHKPFNIYLTPALLPTSMSLPLPLGFFRTHKSEYFTLWVNISCSRTPFALKFTIQTYLNENKMPYNI